MAVASAALPLLARSAQARIVGRRRTGDNGWVRGRMTGAKAIVATLKAEGADLVFGIPGAQQNEMWDAFKTLGLPYLLVTHEYAASCAADGYARATGRPGVICIVPGPGLTNALTGIGEALLDSIPMVCIVGDVAIGAKAKPFQVHSLNQKALLEPVTKCVYEVKHVSGIPLAIRQAFSLACCGEPGPVGVVIPYNLLIEAWGYDSPPLAEAALPWDEAAAAQAVHLLSNRKLQVGIYAGLGCMDYGESLKQVAELLQAPVATSVSGKGAIPESHELAVGWGFGPHANMTAESVFKHVDCLLAIGVKFSEVSTGYYSNPQPKHVVHVDANQCNLGRVLKTDVCVHADAGVFLQHLLEKADCLKRPANTRLQALICKEKAQELRCYCKAKGTCGIHPTALVLALRRALSDDGLLFVDVTVSEHLAAEAFRVCQSRTYFNPTDNQAMGWSIPAAIGAQRAFPGRMVATITGDGCFLMSALEMSTAVRACLPVKFFILDDHTYQYMQMLQEPAFKRTTATVLPTIDYASFAKGIGIAYQEIKPGDSLDASLQNTFAHAGPVLVRVVTDYSHVEIRWIEAVRKHFTKDLAPAQAARFLTRVGVRSLDRTPESD